MRTLFVFFVGILLATSAQSQETYVRWRTFEAVDTLFKQNQKPILINFYSPDCDSCQTMLTQSYREENVANYINTNFYAINFNIQSTKEVAFFDGQKYGMGADNIHNIARALMGDSLSFPAVVVFSKDAQGMVQYGFKTSRQLFPILIYYAEDAYKTTEYDEYFGYFDKVYPTSDDSGYSMVRSVAKWMTIEEALEKQKTEPRKIFIELYRRLQNTSTIMIMQTYNHPVVGNYLNTKYYPVRVDADSRDTILLNTIITRSKNGNSGLQLTLSSEPNPPLFDFAMLTYPNETVMEHRFASKYYFDVKLAGYHQFPVMLLNGRMEFPAQVILNETGSLVRVVNGFRTPEGLEPILHYYATDQYQKTPYDKFLETFKTKIK